MLKSFARHAYDAKLGSLLKESTITPGIYWPPVSVRTGTHIAVLVGGVPQVLCGSHDDKASMAQAKALASSRVAERGFRAVGFAGKVSVDTVMGTDIRWNDAVTVLAGKPAGHIEDGNGVGNLIAILLNDPHKTLATFLSIMTETARAFDPNAPELDDGTFLFRIARPAR